MNLSTSQLAAVDAAVEWYGSADRAPVFRLFGYAGTGKTTIARHIADQIGSNVQFATFTGKAAHILQGKGCPNARTIHSLIYLPKVKSAARLRELRRKLREAEPGPEHDELLRLVEEEQANQSRPSFTLNLTSDLKGTDLLVIDEVSMVGQEIAEDLLTFGVPILALGDPAQLPPVKDVSYFIDAEPDVLLTEIHRQAAESEVLRMATSLRETGDYGGGAIYERGGMSIEQVAEFDQIIVGTNRTRVRSNDRIRRHFGYEGEVPNVGERLICTRNDHELGLLNGSQWIVRSCHEDPSTGRLSMHMTSCDDERESVRCDVHPHPFRDEEIPWFEIREAQCFDYAYAITVHKAQGSEYPRVVVIDEAHKFPVHARRPWRYTAVTRASDEVAIIR